MPEQLGVKFIEFVPGAGPTPQPGQRQILLDYMGLMARQLTGASPANQAEQLRGLMYRLPLLQPGAQAKQRIQSDMKSVAVGRLDQAVLQTALTIENCFLTGQQAPGFPPFVGELLTRAAQRLPGEQDPRIGLAFVTLTAPAKGAAELGYILCDVRLPSGPEAASFDLRIRWAACPMVVGQEAEAVKFLRAYKKQGLVIDIAKEGLLTVFKTRPSGPAEGSFMQQSA